MVAFPASGHSYLVDFKQFKVKLSFASSSDSLTYVVQNPDGSAGQTETVAIRVEAIGPQLFLVTWQESDKTTVVHIEDYANNTIITNITNPDLSFDQYHGSFSQIDAAQPAKVPTYAQDIRPLFRDHDIACMTPKGVKLADPNWMVVVANAQRVFDVLQAGVMPPDGKWSDAKLALFKSWMDGGLQP
jgi:hypothetical protein